MKENQENRKYLDEVWRRIRILEYDDAQIKRVRENKRLVRKIQLRWTLWIFGIPTAIALALFFKCGIEVISLGISTLVFLIASQVYEYLSFIEVRRKIYYEH
ncbi:MAG: hypothetical protein AB2375_02465 [Tissierellaceae bacterium]